MYIIYYLKNGYPGVYAYPVYDCTSDVEAFRAFRAKGFTEQVTKISKTL